MHIDECEFLNTENNVDDSPPVPILYSNAIKLIHFNLKKSYFMGLLLFAF